MPRRIHALAVTLVVLLSLTGWAGANMGPFTTPARAQVVTPDPSPPSFNNQRGVVPDYNVDVTVHTFASGHVDDPNAFPETTARVHNEQGFAQDQHFWLSIRVRQQDSSVEILEQADYAPYGLIAPSGDATYTLRFAPDTSSRIAFEVDGSTDEAVLLTLLQFALDAGFTAAGVTGLGGHEAELGMALAEAVTDQYLSELPTFVPCANTVEAVQRGISDELQFTQELQGCLESPLWEGTVSQVLARLEAEDWFGVALTQAGSSVPVLGQAMRVMDAELFAAQAVGMVQKFRPWEPGAMVGSVAFVGYVAGPPVTLTATPSSPAPTPADAPMFRGNAARTASVRVTVDYGLFPSPITMRVTSGRSTGSYPP